jgi:plasmid stabilization system protein ParE
MAHRKPSLTVVVSNKAASDIEAIYRYNAEHRGIRAADRYEAFLKGKIAGLAEDYDHGRSVERRPHLSYLLMKLRAGGDGHIAVYRVDAVTATVRILHIFHTKQDWESQV